MPAQSLPVSKPRVAAAKDILARLDRLCSRISKLKSFSGKASLYDAARRIHTRAHNLHWDLNCDLKAGGRRERH